MSEWDVQLTETALSDIREATWYMQSQLGAPGSAEAFLDKVDSQLDLLATAPKSRPLVRNYGLAKTGYRWCSAGNFLMFFTLDDEAHCVYVERVLYGARDWRMLL